MDNNLTIYNSLSRKKEPFKPLHPPFVGLYVCGPTVYSDPHLGHARPAITFDLLYRYLTHLGYKVRYVRNITDVGHLENDADEGEDKIEKKARLENLEPMEVVQKYINSFLGNMEQLNTLHPSIEPRASGHIIEQQQLIEQILKKGYAYEVNGSVYFDVSGITKNTCTESFQAGCWMNSRPVHGSSTDRMKKGILSILLSGKKQLLNTLCAGLRAGATDIRDGILNALP